MKIAAIAISAAIAAIKIAARAVASARSATPYAAAGITLRVVRPATLDRSRTVAILSEPQMSNRTIKGDRVALLIDSPSYSNFSPSSLQLALSRLPVPEIANGLLNDAQIAGIENRLRLTSQQAQYWPEVAAALREIGRRYFQARQHQSRARTIPVNSPEVKRLIEAALPLIGQLSEDQKREARQLMQVIGLETVASQI